VRAAEWSKKSAIENHENIFFVEKIGNGYALAVEIGQGKIRRLYI